MTQSNETEEDKDGGKKRGREMTATQQSKRFTLHLSELGSRDAFDEFSYIELLNSEKREGISLVPLDSCHGDFYINTGTLDFRLAENQSISETSIRKKQKLVTLFVSQNSPEDFCSAHTPNRFSGAILKPETKLPEEIAASKLGGIGSSCLAALNLAGWIQPCLNGAKNVLPKLAKVHRTDTALVARNSPTEDCTTGVRQRSTIPEGHHRQNSPSTFQNDLPVQLFHVIHQIKQVIGSSEYLHGSQCGRRRFTKEINQLLVQVENLSQSVTSPRRDTIFRYLALLLSCDQELLAKRAKKLSLARNGDALKDPISRLKEEIQNIMPSLIERHHEETSVAERLLLQQLQPKEHSASRFMSDDQMDDEVHDFVEEKMKRITFPRKKFRWNQAIRMRLCEVVRLKMQQFKTSKIQSQTAEEYLKAFLDAEIKPLWPRGWIQTRMLFKESRAEHQQWTTNLPKFKRMCVFGNKILRSPSTTLQETVASGNSTPTTAPSSGSLCNQHPTTTLRAFAETAWNVKSLKEEDGIGLDEVNRSQTTSGGQKLGAELERISKTAGYEVSVLSPASILSPTLATKYWLLKAALESRPDSKYSELYGGLCKREALMSVPASSVAAAAASSSSSFVRSEAAAAASSVKIETDTQTERSFKSGGSYVADRSGVTAGSSATNEIGSLHSRLHEPSQHLKLTTDANFHSTYLHSIPMDSKPEHHKLADAGNNSPGKLFLSSSSSRFPSIFVFPPGTPLVGVMLCRAPAVSPQPSQNASTDKLQRNPTYASTGSFACGPSAMGSAKNMQPMLSSSQRQSDPQRGCLKDAVQLNLKQTVPKAPPPPEPTPLTEPFVAIPSTLSVFRQLLTPATTT